MGIFDLFTSTPAAETPTPAAETPTQVQPGNLPADEPAATPEAAPNDPLAAFKDIWNTVENKGEQTKSFNLDQDKLKDLVGKADFSSSIPPETLAAISAGGEDAQKAFADAMNTVARTVFMQSLIAGNKLTENHLGSAAHNQEQMIAELVRQQLTTNSLSAASPLFNNPAIKPVMEAVQKQLSAQNPSATPQQITEQAQAFIKALGEAVNPPPAPSGSLSDTTDWSKFLS